MVGTVILRLVVVDDIGRVDIADGVTRTSSSSSSVGGGDDVVRKGCNMMGGGADVDRSINCPKEDRVVLVVVAVV